MRVYSSFFHTLHDEASPVGHLGQGTHHSVLRAVVWKQHQPLFHDFAVIWDEDHDERIIWVAEKLCAEGLLGSVVALGERKGGITVLTLTRLSPAYLKAVEAITEHPPSDSFTATVDVFPGEAPRIINDDIERVRAYLAGIHALWTLGSKPCTFSGGRW